ncbi:MAG: helix-turn-helix transcriptional regulator [Gammaproteobacteria bacterium]|nr:helix-turn-helix transcriptional regulator [Gammaproteobacteria bacterium]
MSIFGSLLQNIRNSLGFWVETAKFDFASEILKEMKTQGISKKELAEKMEVSPAMVTRIISGTHNATIETLVKTAYSMDRKINFNLVDFDEKPKSSIWNHTEILINKDASNETIYNQGHSITPIRAEVA